MWYYHNKLKKSGLKNENTECLSSLNQIRVKKLKFEPKKLLKQIILLTHGSAVGIWKAFVYSLSHEDPAVVLKLALYNFIVILFQFFCYLLKKKLFGRDIF